MSAMKKRAKKAASRRAVPERDSKRSGTRALDDGGLAGVSGGASYEYLVAGAQQLNAIDNQQDVQQLASRLGQLRSERGRRP